MLPVWKLFRIFSFSLRQRANIFRLFHMKKLKIIFFHKNMFFLNNFLNNDRKKKIDWKFMINKAFYKGL